MTFVNPQYLVETGWLIEHLDDPDLRIIDCTQYLPDYFDKVEFATVGGRENYEQGRIPGAAYVDLMTELVDLDNEDIYAPMPSAEQFAAVMSRIGVGEGTRVVLYDDFLNLFAARIWWMLRAFGFDNAALLNGGWPKWKAEGRPISTEPATYPPVNFVARPNPELIAQKDEVLAAIDDDQLLLVNPLVAEEFSGHPDFPHHYGRAGHIPGSVNVPFPGLVDMEADGVLLPADEIRAQYEGVGALAKKQVITYCGGGIGACQAAFVLTLLGVEKIAMYDGSLAEWAADPDLPLVITAIA